MIKKIAIIAVGLAVFLVGAWTVWGRGSRESSKVTVVQPVVGDIESAITATGVVQPQNRLEIKPPISGRIDKVLVEEGQKVRSGDILALMSSTDRAAVLDAAMLQNKETLRNWEDVYKPTPLLAPIDGQVIVKSVNPGQTVTTADGIVVLSDRLIVQAQVDETDIGKVKLGQRALITLDAYPGIAAAAKVDHIYFESKTVNNVTIYHVDILPDEVPDVFRSGMSANVTIVQERRENVLMIPTRVVQESGGQSYVMLRESRDGKPVRQEVRLGLSDGENVEVISGLNAGDRIMEKQAALGKRRSAVNGTNPFMPSPPGGARRGGGH